MQILEVFRPHDGGVAFWILASRLKWRYPFLHRVALEAACHPEDLGDYLSICDSLMHVPNVSVLENFNAQLSATTADADVFRQVLRLINFGSSNFLTIVCIVF